MTAPPPDALLCLTAEGPRTWGHFAADAAELAPRIAGADVVCSLVGDRYEFLVGLGACLLNGQVTALPGAATPGAVAQALEGAVAPLILGRGIPEAPGSRQIDIPRSGAVADPGALLAALTTSAGRIRVFTSGSSGRPVPHDKTWAMLAGGAATTERILSEAGEGPEAILVSTTPFHHMYGLEASIFTALVYRRPVMDAAVLFPADLDAAVARADAAGFESVVLMTSPAHLRFLEQSVRDEPRIRLVVSATAPLSEDQATRIEARGGVRVMEIYGASETGSIGMRRTSEGALWHLTAGFSLTPLPDGVRAEAPHLPTPLTLSDAVALEPDGRFRLLGRLGDMVSIAGKRTSLGFLNAAVADMREVADAVVLRRRTDGDDKLAIVAVAQPDQPPEAGRAALRARLRALVDPVFVPRRIVFTDALPRSGTGKIPADGLASLERLAWPD